VWSVVMSPFFFTKHRDNNCTLSAYFFDDLCNGFLNEHALRVALASTTNRKNKKEAK
jgi:hypothetical protein